MINMEDCKTRLRLLPVCNCGYIFENGIILYEKTAETPNGIKYGKACFEPAACPNCKREIECIVNYVFMRDEV